MGEIARTVGALLALGVAALRAPLAGLPILVVMVVAATFMVTARLTGIAVRDHWRRPAAVDVAVVSGAGVVGSIVFRVGALIFDVRNLVAYGGITIGGAMTASTLTGRRFADRQAGRPRSRAGSSSTRQAGHRRRGPPGGR
jgi:putative ABC transport system permease protein